MTGLDLRDVVRVYEGSDGDATKALYDRLNQLGPAGEVATNLFRAHKNSARAKVYRGGNRRGSYRGQAYDRKTWAMNNLCQILLLHADALGLSWGWAIDVAEARHRHVLYVDLPTGQVSFHTEQRLGGPDYPRQWDGVRGMGAQRICQWCVQLVVVAQEAQPA